MHAVNRLTLAGRKPITKSSPPGLGEYLLAFVQRILGWYGVSYLFRRKLQLSHVFVFVCTYASM